ncbi:MAG: gamma-glutamylcyclotransferase family protein [Opitutaceae bacterium]
MPLIFVYGTLKRRGANHAHLAGQRFVAEARTEPTYRLYRLPGYPGMVETRPPGRSIEGEIWEIDAGCLARLDVLENITAGEYLRAPVRLLPPHDVLRAETYLYLRSVADKPDAGTGLEG